MGRCKQQAPRSALGCLSCSDAFGVVSKPLQKQIWTAARTHLLSQKFAKNQHVAAEHGFGSVAVGAYKCNIYVAHSAVEGGAAVPTINGFLLKKDPPRASQWAGVEDTDPGIAGLQVNLAGWHNPDTSSNPEPGIVISYGGAPGHCGILDCDGFGLSASSDDDPPLNIVTRRLNIRMANIYRFPSP